MDQKKTLWIIAAVGAFLLVVLSAAIIMYSQTSTSSAMAARYVQSKNQNTISSPELNVPVAETFRTGVNDYQNNIPAPRVETVRELNVISDNAYVYGHTVTSDNATTIDLNALKTPMTVEPSQVTTQPQNINITVNIPENKSSEARVVSNEYYKETVKEIPVVTERVVKVPKEEPVKSEPVKVKTQKVAAEPKVASAKNVASVQKASSPVKTASSSNNLVTQYWVQVAAYTNKKGAENARSILETNKISSDIFTYKDNKDKLFYRVRVGPYTTKSEADYWRARIVKIDDFAKADSYVTSTTN